MTKILFSNLNVHTEAGMMPNSQALVSDGIISGIYSSKKNKISLPKNTFEFPESYHLVPGFIDLHVHGANGSDVMDANQNALASISEALAKEGATGFLATTMTATHEEIGKVLHSIDCFQQNKSSQQGAKLLGVHLEGPFLSLKKIGAQSIAKIMHPNISYFEHWQKLSGNRIKLITLAPELPNCLQFIKYLKNKGVIVSLGHTDATYSETQAAIDAGCHYATHLFNAMRSMHHREPGPVLASLLEDKLVTELIVDGKHLHPAIVKLVLKLKPIEKIVLVTDAMRAKCLGDGTYDLGGQAVIVKDEQASLEDGTLAGSVLKMNSALQNVIHFTSCSLFDAIKMVSENPAKVLGVFSKKGSISVGKDADLVVLDDEFNVIMTMREGKVVFSSQESIQIA